MPYTPIAIPCSCRGNASRRIACETVISTPPPAPCTMRNSTITGSVRARPQHIEAAVNETKLATYIRLRPKRADNQAMSGMAITLESM